MEFSLYKDLSYCSILNIVMMVRIMVKNNDAHTIDIQVGKKLKARRIIIGISQEELGKAVGVTFQQIQKYEKGQNRMSASRLFELSKALGVNISYFYEHLYSEVVSVKHVANLAESQENFLCDKVGNDSKEIATLVKAYTSIEDVLVRKKILSLVKSLTPNKKILD